MAKTKHGYMSCPTPDCGERIVVKINEHGTLSAGCQECDFAFYVQKGQAGYARWEAKVEKLSAPKPAAAPAAPPKPAEKKKAAPAPAAVAARAAGDW